MDRILSVVFTLSAIPQAEVTELKQQFDEAKAQNSLLENQVPDISQIVGCFTRAVDADSFVRSWAGC